MMSLYGGNFCDYSYVRSTPSLIMWAKWKVDEWLGPRTVCRMICIMQIMSAFLLRGNTGRSSGTTNGTVLPSENQSEKKEYVQMYSTFLVFTEMTGICLITLEPLEQVEPGTLLLTNHTFLCGSVNHIKMYGLLSRNRRNLYCSICRTTLTSFSIQISLLGGNRIGEGDF